MNFAIRTLCLLAGLAAIAIAQRAGDVPPALVWDKLKGNCPASLDWPGLQGKVVAISFLSDLVFPDDLAEWNEVARKFHSDEVLFIRVAAGSELLLDQALERTPFEGCVLFDSSGVNEQNFDTAAGRTVVMDRHGKIAGYAWGGPDEEDVRAIRNGEPAEGLSPAPPQSQPIKPAGEPDSPPSYEVRISLASKGEWPALGATGAGRYTSRNQPLKLLVLDLWEAPLARIVFPPELDERRYDVLAAIPAPDRETLVEIVQQAIELHFGLQIRKEERIEKVYVLRTLLNPSPHMQAAEDGETWMSGGGQGSIVGTAQTMRDIALVLENLLNVPVLDETGLEGKYSYSVSSSLSGVKAPFDFARQLGLELIRAERPVKMLIVSKTR